MMVGDGFVGFVVGVVFYEHFEAGQMRSLLGS
jgi:hypothetical protein